MKEKWSNLLASFRKFKACVVKKLEKPVSVLKIIFGYIIMISLFVGGLTVLGYIVAFCAGGEAAAQICSFIKKIIIPIVTYMSTSAVLLGIIIMYMSGEVALSAKKSVKKDSKAKDDAGKNA